jgi:hypothetical protein
MEKTLNYTQTKGLNIEDRVLWADEEMVIIGFGIDVYNQVLAHLIPQDIYEEWAPKNIERLGAKYKNEFFPSHSYRIDVTTLTEYNTENLSIKLSYDDTEVEQITEIF